MSKKQSDELSIDFSKVTNIFKRSGSKNNSKTNKSADSTDKSDHDELSLDVKSILNTVWKYRIIILIMIPIMLSVILRAQTFYLPQTDIWAQSSVQNFYRSQIGSQVESQYPNLPAENKNSIINEELSNFINNNKDKYDQEVASVSNNFKSHFQDDEGQTYLLAIDPYQWYRYGKDIVDHGYMGDKKIDGVAYDMHMLAPLGRTAPKTLQPYLGAYLYYIIHPITGINIMGAFFFLPVILMSIAVIPAFFIGRRLAGDISGFFAATILAMHPAVLTRTAGGFSDTDAYTIIFPLFAFWLFIEALETKDMKKQIIFSSLSGLCIGLFAFAWYGWWYIFDFIMIASIVYILYLAVINLWGHGIRNQTYAVVSAAVCFGLFMFSALFLQSNTLMMLFGAGIIISIAYGLFEVFKNFAEAQKVMMRFYIEKKHLFLIVLCFFIVSAISVSFFTSFQDFTNAAFEHPLGIITLKEAAKITLWPNVYTTVAEMNTASIAGIIDAMGGKLLYIIGLVGIFLIIFKDLKEERRIAYFMLVALWFFGAMYASLQGIRFTLILAPAYALGFGVAVGVIYYYATIWISKEMNIQKILVQVILVIILLMFLVPTFKNAQATVVNEVPSMNDAWYDALTKIKTNSSEDAIINSWWDFGHWFKAIADRPVTFDGASQNQPQAHWIGKVLLTSDEEEAIGILRMLDCGGNTAFDILNGELNNAHRSVDLLYVIIKQDRDDALETLEHYVSKEKAEEIISNTHCTPPEDFFITSEDMVGKSGVWAHFGAWDFEKANIWRDYHKKPKAAAVQGMINEFNYTKEQAEDIYDNIKTITDEKEANDWISPWPGYITNTECQKTSNTTIFCQFNLQDRLMPLEIDTVTQTAKIETTQGRLYAYSLSFIDDSGEFRVKYAENNTLPYSLAISVKSDGITGILMSPELAGSMFTRLFYFDGIGLKHFDFFDYQKDLTGLEIYTWKVDWDGKENFAVSDSILN